MGGCIDGWMFGLMGALTDEWMGREGFPRLDVHRVTRNSYVVD